MTVEEVKKALSTVIEPDLKKDLISLDMVKDIEVKNNEVSFTVVLTTPACPLKGKIQQDCEEAILKADASAEVTVNFTSDVTTVRHNANMLPGVKNIIAVASGKGGVGKSTCTVNLAVALAKTGARVGLVDADIFGPSIPLMMDVEDEKPGVVQEDGKNFIIPIRNYGVDIISIGLLTDPDQAVVWRGPMASSALKQFMTDCKWGELDYLLIDLPPGTSDIHLTLVQSVPVTGAVIVTTPQKVALADAIKGIAMFKQKDINVPVLGLIENMAWFTPKELPDNKYYIFGEGGGVKLAEEIEAPLLAQIPLVQGIRQAGDDGKPVILSDEITAKAFETAAENLAQQVAIRNATKDPTKPVEVKI